MGTWHERVEIEATLISAGVFLKNLLDEACANQVFSEIISPGKKYNAIVFQRDCGATTGFSTQISILEIDNSLGNKPGNVYIVGGHPEKFAPEVNWVSDQKLIINSDYKGSEFKAETNWGMSDAVDITYSASGS